jgi:hypothetical protein
MVPLEQNAPEYTKFRGFCQVFYSGDCKIFYRPCRLMVGLTELDLPRPRALGACSGTAFARPDVRKSFR